jgi:SAM-dependent methyltransferase
VTDFRGIVKLIVPIQIRVVLYKVSYKIRWLFYRGNNFYCVCCGKSSEKFLNYGNVTRANAACPYCNSLERTRLLNYYLVKETDIFSGHKEILHFAPDGKLGSKLKKQSQNYVSADLMKGIADEVQDIQQLSYSDNKFDYIICSCVLGHVPNEEIAINEIYRVLKPGGKAFIMTVINLGTYKTLEDPMIKTEVDKLNFYGEKDLLRYHGEDFEHRLQRDNVEISKIDYSKEFSEEDQKKYSLGNKERELIFVAEKLIQ